VKIYGKSGCGSRKSMVHISALMDANIVVESYIYIVTCRVVRVTKLTGSSSDDRIYWNFV
jgi:hypothetical protein